MLGLALALSLANVLRDLIGTVRPRDPVVFTSVILGLFTAAVASSWLPARRAASIEPTITLRQE